MRRHRRGWLLLFLALVAPACGLVGGGDDDGGDAAQPAQPTLPASTAVLRVASGVWPSCLHPLTCDDPTAAHLVWEHVLPTLMELAPDGTYVPSPVLAGMPEVRIDDVSGQQTVTFVLDPAARWHDGRPITSSDVAGTWLARRATPGALTDGHELITAVDDRDPLVARVTLAVPVADWPELFGGRRGWLLQADAFGGELDLTGRFDAGLGFGAGPFELASIDDRTIVLEGRDEHWDAGRQASVDQVRIERLPEDAPSDITDVVSAGIDLVVPRPAADTWPARFQLRERPTSEVVGIFLDRRSPPLGAPAVRDAIAAALDRQGLLDPLGGSDEVVTCLAGVPQQPTCADDLPAEAADDAAAEALLDGDGWSRDADGARGRPGLPLLVPVSYDPDLAGAEEVAEEVAEVLAELGAGVVLQATDAATWADASREGSTGVGVFAAPLASAGDVVALYRCDPTLNRLGWCEVEDQELVAQLSREADLGRQGALREQLSELAASVTAWLPLHQRTHRLLVDPERADLPDEVPIGSGPLGGLHAFARVEQ